MWKWVGIIVEFLWSAFRERSKLLAENLALRHQVMVLKRSVVRPKIRESDRLFWVLYSKCVVGWQDLVEFVQVRTVTQWQKRRFGRFWFSKTKSGKVGRPTISKELRGLIRQMSKANPLWGTPRIIGELEKLGIEVSRATVDKYRVRVRQNPSPTWKAFLKNEAKAIAAIDFFTVATVNFRVLYVFVVVMHDRRRVIHFNVTEHPSAEWAAQQIVEAFP